MLLLTGACVAVMLTAVVARVTSGWPAHLPARLSALGVCALLPIGLLAWLTSGPLAAGWAKRAGTPTALLAAAHAASGLTAGGSGSAQGSSHPVGGTVTAPFRGTVRQGQLGPGPAVVDISLAVRSARLHDLHIRIEGRPIDGGGVQMTDSQVSLGSASNPDRYTGRVTALQGSTVQATVSDAIGTRIVLLARLQLAGDGHAATGVLTATTEGSG